MDAFGEETRKASDSLDSVGNVTKALAKGFGMSAATMSSLVILFAYLLEFARLEGFTLTSLDQYVVKIMKLANAVAIFFGEAMPYLLSALTIRAVNEDAFRVIEEIGRHFKIPGLLEGKVEPKYANVVDLTTTNALKRMVGPTLVTILVPILIGFLQGP